MKGIGLYSRTQGLDLDGLVREHSGLVRRVAYHLLARLPDSVQVDDLIQAGMVGLLEAAQRYDASAGASFATFAERRVRGAMLDETRRGDWTPRSVHRRGREVSEAIRTIEAETGAEARDRDVAERLGLPLEEYHALLGDLRGQRLVAIEDLAPDEDEVGVETLVSPAEGPAEQVQREQAYRRLAGAIDKLPERERLILALYYDEDLNLKEIGAVLGVSESRVCQLHGQALARLRARVNQ